jgi:hypothetical protein
MKIAITGHCNGLGYALYNKLTIYNRAAGHEVVGFDQENGYDIAKLSNISKILYKVKDYDVFINNAYHHTGQTEILKYLLKLWHNKNKVIIHIGTYLIHDVITDTILPLHQEYIDIKKNQRQLINEHRQTDRVLKIVQVNPGLMETEFLKIMQVPNSNNLQNIFDCADVVVYTLDMLNQGIYIKEITLNNL